MHTTRRAFVRGGTIALAAAAVPNRVYGSSNQRGDPHGEDTDFRKTLIAAAIDAASSAGVTYADARLSFTQELRSHGLTPFRIEAKTFGIRALVGGYWGFASGPVWTTAEAARLGKAAVAQAKANAVSGARETDLAPLTQISSGDWIMPVKEDPFRMSYDEINDYLRSIVLFIRNMGNVGDPNVWVNFLRQDKAFGSSLGQFTTQRVYRTSATVAWKGYGIPTKIDSLSVAGLGFEYIRDQPLRQYIEIAQEEARRDSLLPEVPADVGRYQVLVHATGVAGLVSNTIGVATELDRAIGYEVNAGGSSYINEPQSMLGSLRIGSSQLTVDADRSDPGSVACVRWDDEGVEPTRFTIVQDGILTDMQTNRETAGWLKSHGVSTGHSGTSVGCAYTPDATDTPLIHCANLRVRPAVSSNVNLDALRQSMTKGIEWKSDQFTMDFQQISGYGRGQAYEVRSGERVARINGAGMLFRTQELWNNLIQLGDSSTVGQYGMETEKGQPSQKAVHSVTVPPALFKETTIIDVMRKA